MYVIQGCWANGTISHESSCDTDDTEDAIREGRKLLHDATFEGDYVRIITLDSELVWDSRKEGAE